MQNKLTKGDIVLLLLYANNCSPIIGRTRFQKILFVFEKEIYKQYGFDKKIDIQTPNLFNFSAYHYGPFSTEAYKLLEFFINIGIVNKESESAQEVVAENINDYSIVNDDFTQFDDKEDMTLPSPFMDEKYVLSSKGKEYVSKNLIGFYNEKKEVLDKFKSKFIDSSLQTILRYVYTKYPEMTTNSKIKDEILK